MLSRDEVDYVARLARLALSDDELDRMAAELSGVLGHIDRMRTLDLSGVEASARVLSVADDEDQRADEPRPSLSRDVILAAAPEVADGGFAVPSPGASAA